jgi:nitroreductase
MEFYETLRKRRTIRKFQGPATTDQLDRILEAGTAAPSAGNRQSWEFIVVEETDLIDKIGEIKLQLNRNFHPPHMEDYLTPEQIVASQGAAQKESFRNASLIMVYHRKKGLFEEAGTWMAIENMSLAAAAEGLGSRIATFWGDGIKEIQQLLQVPEEFQLAAALTVGVPAEEPGQKKNRPQKSWLHCNRFGIRDRRQ